MKKHRKKSTADLMEKTSMNSSGKINAKRILPENKIGNRSAISAGRGDERNLIYG